MTSMRNLSIREVLKYLGHSRLTNIKFGDNNMNGVIS